MYAAATIREVDKLAARAYPDSWKLWGCASDPRSTPEFYRAPWVLKKAECGCCDFEYMDVPDDQARRLRTRAALIAYVARTGKWMYAHMVLK